MEIRHAILTDHARERLASRQLNEADILGVLESPEEILTVRPGRVVAQRISGGYLVRVFVDIDRQPPEVVTAYRTRKVEKYRSQNESHV